MVLPDDKDEIPNYVFAIPLGQRGKQTDKSLCPPTTNPYLQNLDTKTKIVKTKKKTTNDKMQLTKEETHKNETGKRPKRKRKLPTRLLDEDEGKVVAI